MIALVTGATRGIGAALAAELGRRGHTVYGGGRKWNSSIGDLGLGIGDCKKEPPLLSSNRQSPIVNPQSANPQSSIPNPQSGIIPLTLDVTDEASCTAAIGKILSEQGRLDLLVNNAGISHCGSIEDTPVDYARAVFETNYLGPVRLIRAALPALRRQGSGTVAIVGSAAGRIGIPFQGHYAASKFAVEGLAESLWHELRPFGIRVMLIEPGDVGTTIWRDRDQVLPAGSAYAAALGRFLAVKDREMGPNAAPPETVAVEIADALLSDCSCLRRPVAPGARFVLFLRKVLPDTLFFYILSKNYRQ